MASNLKLQCLIHEGEVNEIVRIIQAGKGPEVKIVGNLFGLWRHSLTQPVVQLIAGPGKSARLTKDVFSPDHDYHDKCKNYLRENHGLLQIGLWASGSARRYTKLDPRHANFARNSSLLPGTGKYAVILFVNTHPNLSMEFFIINRNPQHSLVVSHNTIQREDILRGESCFRLLEPVFEAVNRGAMFSLKNRKQKCYFSRDELRSSFEADKPVAAASDERSEEQWYETDYGADLVAKLVNTFERSRVSVEMSRNPKSKDMTFELNGKLCLNFPSNFPEAEPSLSLVNDKRIGQPRNQDDICQRLVYRVTRVLEIF